MVKPDVSARAEVEEAARMALAHDFIERRCRMGTTR